MAIEPGPQFPVQRFETVNPEGKNSIYTRLPDNRWSRHKTATGETHVQGITRFVHPKHMNPVKHPIAGVNDYRPLELALAHGDLLDSSGKIQIKTVGEDGKSTPSYVPDEDISHEPKEGWIPVEHTTNEKGNIINYHMGHPVAPLGPRATIG